MCTIYCYTNKITGKKYVGQTIHPEQRKRNHIHEATKKGSDYYFHKSIRKHGIENFSYEVLEETENPNERETYYIKKLDTYWPNGYNMIIEHNGMPEEIRKKISETKKRQWKELSEEEKNIRRENLRQSNIGRLQSDHQKETVKKLRQKEWIITHPDGTKENIINLNNWCKEKGFGTNGQSNLVRGSYKEYKAKVVN